MISQLNVALNRKLRGSFICVAYFISMLSMGVCTTRHWQTSGRLVLEFNVCAVNGFALCFDGVFQTDDPVADVA